MSDIHSRLRHQSLGRPLTPEERALADALEAVFRTGDADFEEVARALERERRASGLQGPRAPWTAAVWSRSSLKINTSLEPAYAENGIGA